MAREFVRLIPMRIGWGIILACCAGLLGACRWEADPRDLTAETAAAQPGPDCASCHAYVGIDDPHDFHMNEIGRDHADNSPITCLDCHATAIASAITPLLDSIFVDTYGDTISLLNNPYDPDIHGYPMVRVDTLRRQLPISMPGKPGISPPYQEYVTSLAHLNNTLDVAFDLRSSDTARFSGSSARYNPKDLTCSAVACHGRGNAYRWLRLVQP